MGTGADRELREHVNLIWKLVEEYGGPTPSEIAIREAVDIFIAKGDWRKAYILTCFVNVNRLDFRPAMDILFRATERANMEIVRKGNGES
jgi:hypothetical protein